MQNQSKQTVTSREMAESPAVTRRDASATRQKLIETAERLFAESGYTATTIDRIAAESGINKRMIYVYFADKEGLYKAVLAHNFQGALHLNRPIDLTEMAASGYLHLAREQISHYFEYLGNNPRFVRLLMRENLDGGKRAGGVLVEMAAQALDSLHEIIRRGGKEGQFKVGLDERKLVTCINAMCLGYFSERALLQALWGEDITSPKLVADMQEFIVDLVMNGIRPREAADENGSCKE